MRSLKKLIVLSVSIIGLMTSGCFNTPPIKSLTEAEQHFLKICKEENSLEPQIKMLDHTLWIYLPFDGPIVDFKGSKNGPSKSKSPGKSSQMVYLDGEFKENSFYLEYATDEMSSYKMDPGVANVYPEDFTKKQQLLMTAVYRAYSDLKTVPGDLEFAGGSKDESHRNLVEQYIKTEDPPVFVMLVIADVKRGLEVTNLFHFQDLKRVMTGEMPQEEYGRRAIAELRGQEDIIGDHEGNHVDYRDIKWPEFLSKQMLNRIRAGWKPATETNPDKDGPQLNVPNDVENEMMRIVAETLGAYHFENFSHIKLHRLTDDQEFLFSKDQLKSYKKTE